MLVRVLQVGGGLAAVLVVAFTLSFRTKFGPVLDAIRRINRKVTNPRVLATAGEPGASASVVHHVGRRTTTSYRTPVVAVPADDAYVVALPYGPRADWVRNVLAAGTATLTHEGRTIPVDRPALLPVEDANPWFPRKEQVLHRLYRVEDFLVLHPSGDA